jgi:6-phosphogluconate dehydrogenase
MPGKKKQALANVGLIGLGVMGRNLVLNLADHGFRVAVFNRTYATTTSFVQANPDTPGGLLGCKTLKKMVSAVERPRKLILLVPSGAPVDATIALLAPLVDRGDVIIDGGNSEWTQTIRREKELAAKGIHFVGSGVSGGEEGARFGPSLMPGGSKQAWKAIKPIWNAISAKVDRKTGRPIEGAQPGKPVRGGEPCAAYIGSDGAGHYVKMVHNGIEYADMQLISEAYFLMKRLLGLKPDEMSEIFARWNEGDLDSFLIEITADILRQRDPDHPRRFLVDSILDAAGQKGTGKWTSMSALDMGVAAPTIAEAVFARIISSFKEQRVAASKKLRGPRPQLGGISRQRLIEAVHDALYASKVCAYAQGFALMNEAQSVYGWKLNFSSIAKIWRGACNNRARFLQKITDAYKQERRLPNLLLYPKYRGKVSAAQDNWRLVVATAAKSGVPSPAFMSALAYFDSYRSANLPANLIQAQRDYFGAHTYERVDRPRGRFFHLDWPHPDRPQSKA